MRWLRARSYQDWLLTIMSVVALVFIAHVWIADAPRAEIAVVGTPAREIRDSQQWLVQFVFRNRGEANANRVRLRILTGNLMTPDKLQINDDFLLANELDPGNEVIRVFTTAKPAQAPAPKEEPKPAPAPTPAPAAGRGAQAAAAPPPPPPPPPAPAAEPPDSYVVVLQADYETNGGIAGGIAHRRWYYFYREGDAAAVQIGEALRQRVSAAADTLLR